MCASTVYSVLLEFCERNIKVLGWDLNTNLISRAVSYQLDHRDYPVASSSSCCCCCCCCWSSCCYESPPPSFIIALVYWLTFNSDIFLLGYCIFPCHEKGEIGGGGPDRITHTQNCGVFKNAWFQTCWRSLGRNSKLNPWLRKCCVCFGRGKSQVPQGSILRLIGGGVTLGAGSALFPLYWVARTPSSFTLTSKPHQIITQPKICQPFQKNSVKVTICRAVHVVLRYCLCDRGEKSQ